MKIEQSTKDGLVPLQVLQINTDLKMKDLPFESRASFWRQLNLWPLKSNNTSADSSPLLELDNNEI